MTMEFQKVTLANIAGGAVPELFDRELSRVLDNIADINTPHKKARVITIEISVVPTEDRATGLFAVQASSKLAQPRAVAGAMEFVQEGRKQVAYQAAGRQGELLPDNVTYVER